jgi:NAD(P)H-flavin reductase
LELVISAHDGFTNDLYKYAMKNPGAVLRASIDGPYGAIPDFSKTTDKVILVAGGSGASFTFGIALDMIKKLGDKPKPTIELIWTVREQGKEKKPLIANTDEMTNRILESLALFIIELVQLRL